MLPTNPVPALVPMAASQTVEFTSDAPAAALVGGSYIAVATASSGLPVKLSIGGKKDACRLSGAIVSFRESGTCVVEAHQAGGPKYREARAQQSFAIGRAPQAIVFSSTPPAPAVAGGPPYTVAATASSGLEVSFAAGAASSGVCTVSGSIVSLVGAGTCKIEADQAGNGSHEPAPRVRQSFPVQPAALAPRPQSISFASTTPASGIVGGPIYSVSATASSGLAVGFSAASGSAGVCTVSGAVVTFVGEGTCTVKAQQAGDDLHLPAPTVQQAFPVDRAPQAVSFLSSPPLGATAGSTLYAVAAAATSGLPVSFAVAESSASVCAIAGATVTAIDTGTCTIEASQPGDQMFRPAAPAQQSFGVDSAAPSLSDQTISFTSSPPAPATIGGPDYNVAAAATSGLPIAFSVSAGQRGHLLGVGLDGRAARRRDLHIHANQAGSPDTPRRRCSSPSQSEAPPDDQLHLDAARAGSSGRPGLHRHGDGELRACRWRSPSAPASAVCTIAGPTVSFVGAGTCVIDANQAGRRQLRPGAAGAAVVHRRPGRRVPDDQLHLDRPGRRRVGGAGYTVDRDRQLGPAGRLHDRRLGERRRLLDRRLDGVLRRRRHLHDQREPGRQRELQRRAAGAAVVRGRDRRGAQTISFTSTAPACGGVWRPDLHRRPRRRPRGSPSRSPSPPARRRLRSRARRCRSSAPARASSTPTRPANANYNAAPQVQQSFTVARASQTISFTSTPQPGDKHGPTYTMTATATSGLAITFSIAPASAAICSISGASVSFKKHGDCVVRANQAGGANYLPAPQAQQVITVFPHV